VRLVGVTAIHLCSAHESGSAAQLDLFARSVAGRRLGDVARAVDQIRRQFGAGAITRAALLEDAEEGAAGEKRGGPPERKRR
jgi:hypothetical protein